MNAEIIIQLRDTLIRQLVDEDRKGPDTPLQQTFDDIEPIDLNGVGLAPLVNVERGAVEIKLLPSDQRIGLNLHDTEVQLVIDHKSQNQKSLSVLEADIAVTAAVGVNKDKRVETVRLEDESDIEVEVTYVEVGLDMKSVDDVSVQTTLNQHPFEDDSFIAELFLRVLQNLYEENGPEFPTKNNHSESPGRDFGYFTSDFTAYIENDVGGDSSRTIRVNVLDPPAPFSQTEMEFVFPVCLRWANIKPASPTVSLESPMKVTSEIRISAPIDRNDKVSIGIQGGKIIVGEKQVNPKAEENLNDPNVAAIVDQALRDFGETIAKIGPLEIDNFEKEELEKDISAQMQSVLAGAFIPFWEQKQSDFFLDAFTAVMEGVLAIGFNGQVFEDLDPLIPDDCDFAILTTNERVVHDLDTYLTTREEYDDVAGDIRVAGSAPVNSGSLEVGGFTQEKGTVRKGTRFVVKPQGVSYKVEEDAPIENHKATLAFDPVLTDNVKEGQEVAFRFGFGLPNRCFDENKHSDALVREYCIEDLNPSLGNGHVRLAGPLVVRRNAVALKKINGDLVVKLGMEWVGSARVDGGSQSGDTIRINEIHHAHDVIRTGTHLSVDGTNKTFYAKDDAKVEDGKAVIKVAPDLPLSPEHRAQVLFTWVASAGTIDGTLNGESPGFAIHGIKDGEDLVPKGAKAELTGTTHVVAASAVINSGSVELKFEEQHTSPGAVTLGLVNSPPDGAVVRITGLPGIVHQGLVDGEGQIGKTLHVRGIERFIKGASRIRVIRKDLALFGPTLTSAVDFGTYRLGRDDVPIEDNIARIRVRPDDALLDEDRYEGTIITFRDGRQNAEQRTVEKPEVKLGTTGLLESIAALLIGIFTSSIWAAIFTGVAIHLIRSAFQNIASRELESEVGDFKSLLPDELRRIGVDVDYFFKNPVAISEDGIVLSGNSEATSRYSHLDDAQADSGGPYVPVAGTATELKGGRVADKTDYLWLTGDGSLYNERVPAHTYSKMGYRIASLTTFNNQFGKGSPAVRSRHLTVVRVQNTIPTVLPLTPIVAFEGEEIMITATFTDLSWPDKHVGYVDFGDDSLPTKGTVIETNEAPKAQGTVTAKHTYCDNGMFAVTVTVVDEHGGSQTAKTTATIINLPPVVDAGPDMVTHPCVPLRLVGYFEDPGWCDTHVGVWNFGDCTPTLCATIVEDHKPPKGQGIAIGSHCYKTCGVYTVELVITDDDGAAASDTLVVRVTDVQNSDFELGFRHHGLGLVANEWEAYASGEHSTREAIFLCERCAIRSGEMAQGIAPRDREPMGILQRVRVNPGWEYQVTAFAHIAANSGGRVRLGVDPLGGTLPSAPSIVWSESEQSAEWIRLTSRCIAGSSHLTIFLEAREFVSDAAFFDCVEMLAFPCTTEMVIPPVRQETECVDWGGLDPGLSLTKSVAKGELLFESLSGASLRSVLYGLPSSVTKLEIPYPNDGLRVSWSGLATRVVAKVFGDQSVETKMTAFDASGTVLDWSEGAESGLRIHDIEREGIDHVLITAQHRGTLLEICVTREVIGAIPESTIATDAGPTRLT